MNSEVWISVNDKMPNENENVIVCGYQESGDTELLTFYNTATHNNYGWSDAVGLFTEEQVLFWQPLPTPPTK